MLIDRGALSIPFKSEPQEGLFGKGLLILSCSEEYAIAIHKFAGVHYSNVDWTILYRYDAGNVFKTEKLVLSSNARSITTKMTLLREIRRTRFDVVWVAWTNERSYGFLKLFALFSNFLYLRVFNENIDAFYLNRSSFKKLVQHLVWRWQSAGSLRFPLLNMISWIVLFPLGLLYLCAKTMWFALKHLLYSKTSSVK